jgi:glycosyltransferase involved in cell wall biosynthesis
LLHRSSPEFFSGLGYAELTVTLPPGWASKFARLTARHIWTLINGLRQRGGPTISALVVTSPHYLPLVELARHHVPTFYYCSDDYSRYAGWGGNAILRAEADVVEAVCHSFFVSNTLAQRAIRAYGVSAERVSVSPNATERSFLEPATDTQLALLMNQAGPIRKPLVGVVGGINDRLDFDILLECANLPEVGTLAMVGPVWSDIQSTAWDKLRAHPKCLVVGAQPHEDIATWMQALDLALIPYRNSPLNEACSPMRLFDHLASGRPIVATAHCKQILEFKELLECASRSTEFLASVVRTLSHGEDEAREGARRAAAACNLWECRAEGLQKRIREFI